MAEEGGAKRGARGRGRGHIEEGGAWPRKGVHRGGGARQRRPRTPRAGGSLRLRSCGWGEEEGVVCPCDAGVRRRAGERAEELPGSGRSDPSLEARLLLSGPGGTPVSFCKMGPGRGQAAKIVMLWFEETKASRG